MKPGLPRPTRWMSAPAGSGPARRCPRLLAVAAAVVLALTGCGLTSPLTTQVLYEPADGLSMDMGSVQVLDLLVVAEAEGAPGMLSGYVVNNGREAVTLSISTDPTGAQPTEVEVPAQGTLRLDGAGQGAEHDPVVIESVAAMPGGLLPVSIHTPQSGVSQAEVPVLLPQGPYETVTPEPTS